MRQRLLLILIGIVVLVGGSVAVVLLVKRSPALQNTVYKLSNTTAPMNAATNVNTKPAPPPSPDRATLTTLTRNFTERFGSGSNQNRGENYLAVKNVSTALFSAELDRLALAISATPPSAPYAGTITKALVFTFTKLTPTIAVVVVSTQQQSITPTASTTANRNLTIDLIKIGADWKVNAAVWK